jgi:hypothetical protein
MSTELPGGGRRVRFDGTVGAAHKQFARWLAKPDWGSQAPVYLERGGEAVFVGRLDRWVDDLAYYAESSPGMPFELTAGRRPPAKVVGLRTVQVCFMGPSRMAVVLETKT